MTHIRGPILEETHYYPFGLTMAGISSTAIEFGKPVNNRNKFQNQEFNQGLNVDMYEFKYRMHDPQIGRFWQIDPLADKYLYNSTYAFSENHVTTHVELEGLEKQKINNEKWPWEKGSGWKPEPTKMGEKKNADLKTDTKSNKNNGESSKYGFTVTAKVGVERMKIDPGTGDRVKVYSFQTTDAGQPGSIATLNKSNSMNKTELDNTSIILGNNKTGSINASSNMKRSGGIGFVTPEGIGMNVGVGFLQNGSILSVTLEGSYSSPNVNTNGVGVKVDAGGIAMEVAAAPIAAAAKIPKLIFGLLKL